MIFVCSLYIIVRLNGPNVYSGTIEIYYGDTFGSVCDDSWGGEDATVVCRQLGYDLGTPVTNAQYGMGTGPIWLDEVSCNGNEVTIVDCIHNGWNSHDCSHGEDAGVICGKCLISPY